MFFQVKNSFVLPYQMNYTQRMIRMHQQNPSNAHLVMASCESTYVSEDFPVSEKLTSI